LVPKSAPAPHAPGLAGWLAAALLALAVVAANLAVWNWLNRPIDAPDWEGPVEGMAYNFYQRDQSPLRKELPSDDEVAADMKLLSAHTKRIRTYTAAELERLPDLAAQQGLRVTAGAWLDQRKDNNAVELEALARAVKRNRQIDRVLLGNETVLLGRLKPEELVAYVKQMRRKVNVPISTAEPWHVWLKHPELAKAVDYITVHLLPYWEGVPVEEALADVEQRYEMLKRAYPKKYIVIGEVGWPSNGDRFQGAFASRGEQARFIRLFLHKAEQRHWDYFLMEAVDQPWKIRNEGRVGPYWGMFNADREPKFPLAGPILADPMWTGKAALASLIAFPLMLVFAGRFRHFRLAGRLFYAALIQAAVAVAVWMIALPFDFYLNGFDWLMLVVVVPALVAMIAILLANGFEFTEVLWNGGWKRRFAPRNDPADAPKPFVSVHLACYNEPPEMVIATIDSLAALDYPHYEVLVIDNNTTDEALWKPVEAHCAMLAGRHRERGVAFKFVHLPKWPGFKAGALNYGLQHLTDPRAEVVGVVDADYVVRPDWLASLVGYFADDPKVAVVQAPQSHREFEHSPFQRMTNWEFDGFFRLGMHHRNERNAIIQHGTMTLVRKSALVGTGNWSEWCICEDAELGLRLMHAGYQTLYVDEEFGKGLTPADFKSFKSQRFRWAFGAMQILKGRWRWLAGRGPLTAGQRFHFLTGWFSWFGDALHFVFTFAALLWTIGMLALPEHFTLPIDLFLIPLLGFFMAKAAFGPILYAAKVKCGAADNAGAALASMALSHAIAAGVWAGLTQKEGAFVKTAKSWKARVSGGVLGAVKEEALMLLALGLGMLAMLWRDGLDHRETNLWIAILAAQSLPYVSALAVSWISAWSERRQPAGDAAATPAPASLHPAAA
jgi:cellulose synthase/poly-beta-1,6-N-acetylglucosamine synthase-like glycosyltransferase/exo-beta-1,3-glucanase (GH17 family)